MTPLRSYAGDVIADADDATDDAADADIDDDADVHMLP